MILPLGAGIGIGLLLFAAVLAVRKFLVIPIPHQKSDDKSRRQFYDKLYDPTNVVR